MHNQVLGDIDFARQQRWLGRAVAIDAVLVVFDRSGGLVWGGEAVGVAELGTELVATAGEDAVLRRHELKSGKSALVQSLGQTKDGRIGWAAVVVDAFDPADAPIALDQAGEVLGDLVEAIGQEYRHRVDLEMMTEELGARYEELHLIYAVDHHVQSSEGSGDAVFQGLLESAAAHLRVDVAAFVRPSKNVCLHAKSPGKEIHNLDLVLVEMRGDLYRFLQSSGEPLVMNASNDPRRSYIFTDMPYKILACPVHTERRVDSMVVLLNHDDKPDFTNSDRKLAEVLANHLSSLSDTFLLLQSMQEFNEQIAKALIEAVEAKDPYTRGHSERVHFLAMEIGRAMGFPADELTDLHWGSLLHDVGKIGIPDAVLCKPGRLTKDEYTFIMVHPERSYEILRHIKHLDKAVMGARHHQEMYDGSGYPHGLKGERIPLHARVIAVADTYDSITSSRAYRAGRSHEVAMAEIDRVAGTQLDPAIVKVFKGIVATEPEWLTRFKIKRDRA